MILNRFIQSEAHICTQMNKVRELKRQELIFIVKKINGDFILQRMLFVWQICLQ